MDAQILLLMVTAIGVIISIILGINTIREQKEERRLSVRPRVVHKTGGIIIDLKIKNTKKKKPKKIENVNNYFQEHMVNTLHFVFGKICNYGLGCAYDIECIWKADKIIIDRKEIDITEDMLNRGPFNINFDCSNKTTVENIHLLPNECTELCNLPIFIGEDTYQKVEIAIGTLIIKFNDIYDENYITEQGFIITPFYKGSSSIKQPHIILSVGKKHSEEDIRDILYMYNTKLKKTKK